MDYTHENTAHRKNENKTVTAGLLAFPGESSPNFPCRLEQEKLSNLICRSTCDIRMVCWRQNRYPTLIKKTTAEFLLGFQADDTLSSGFCHVLFVMWLITWFFTCFLRPAGVFSRERAWELLLSDILASTEQSAKGKAPKYTLSVYADLDVE